MNTSQWLYFVPLALGVLWLGVHPTSISASIEPSTKKLLTQMSRQAPEASTQPEASIEEPVAEEAAPVVESAPEPIAEQPVAEEAKPEEAKPAPKPKRRAPEPDPNTFKDD